MPHLHLILLFTLFATNNAMPKFQLNIIDDQIPGLQIGAEVEFSINNVVVHVTESFENLLVFGANALFNNMKAEQYFSSTNRYRLTGCTITFAPGDTCTLEDVVLHYPVILVWKKSHARKMGGKILGEFSVETFKNGTFVHLSKQMLLDSTDHHSEEFLVAVSYEKNLQLQKRINALRKELYSQSVPQIGDRKPGDLETGDRKLGDLETGDRKAETGDYPQFRTLSD